MGVLRDKRNSRMDRTKSKDGQIGHRERQMECTGRKKDRQGTWMDRWMGTLMDKKVMSCVDGRTDSSGTWTRR